MFLLSFTTYFLTPDSDSITLGLSYHPTPGGLPEDYSAWHAWAGFAVVASTNTAALLFIALRRDIVWCIAATWICISVWSDGVKPAPVYVSVLPKLLLPLTNIWYADNHLDIHSPSPSCAHRSLHPCALLPALRGRARRRRCSARASRHGCHYRRCKTRTGPCSVR